MTQPAVVPSVASVPTHSPVPPDVRLVTDALPATVTVNKVASVTRGLLGGATARLAAGGPARSGDVVVVQALEEKRVYGQLELVGGRVAHIARGDILAGVLGSRKALKGFVGVCPTHVYVDDVLHVLNLGGVMGCATSANPDFGQPLRVRVLGLAERDGRIINLADGAVPPAETLNRAVPLVVIAGTCMAAGKTHAACEIIARLAARGLKVAGLKLSGVAALRDTLNMVDHGAVRALSFLDAGYPSTADASDLAPMARGLINAVAADDVDLVVVEMGDGLIGGYGVQSFYAAPDLRNAVAAHVVCANDLVAAWGGAALANDLNCPIDVLSGPATDNEIGVEFVEHHLGIPGANARTHPERLAELVLNRLPFAAAAGR